jgi:hypothetical protein
VLQRHPHRPTLRIKVDDQVVADGLRAAAVTLGQGDVEGVGVRELADLHRGGGWKSAVTFLGTSIAHPRNHGGSAEEVADKPMGERRTNRVDQLQPRRAGPLHAPPRARAKRELAGWPALAFRGGDGRVPSRRPLASAVHVFKLPRL